MSGGYFSCGRFSGEDKSGTAFFEMLDDIQGSLSPDQRRSWDANVAQPLQSMLDGRKRNRSSLTLPAELVKALAPHVDDYRRQLSTRLGDPDPATEAPEIGEFKTGEGWRLYCAWDFLRAAEVSHADNKPVVLHFD